jgi:ribosome-associated protein
VTATDRAAELARIAAQAAADKQAKDISIVDVSDRLAITDCFVIVTGTNDRQVGAIVEGIEEAMRLAGVKPVRREGEREGRWVLLDFLDVVVHVQHSEERVFYALDRLWKDCPTIPFVDAADPRAQAAGTPASDATGSDRSDESESGASGSDSLEEAPAQEEPSAEDVLPAESPR